MGISLSFPCESQTLIVDGYVEKVLEAMTIRSISFKGIDLERTQNIIK
jgi:hypothetical protein